MNEATSTKMHANKYLCRETFLLIKESKNNSAKVSFCSVHTRSVVVGKPFHFIKCPVPKHLGGSIAQR